MRRKAELERLIKQLSSADTTRILNPKAALRLRKEGIKLRVSKPLSDKKKIDALFSRNRKKAAMELAERLPKQPEFPAPSINALYAEIRSAIILGLNGAAITLSGILVEHVLRYATYKVEMGGFQNYDPAKMDRFEQHSLKTLIQLAKKKGLLNDTGVKKLDHFNDRCRNPYNHYNLKKIAGESEGPITVIDLNNATSEVQNVKAKDSLIVQAQIKPEIDARNVFGIFAFADSVVKHLWQKINELESSSIN